LLNAGDLPLIYIEVLVDRFGSEVSAAATGLLASL
jgi:hypothetical protein